MEKVETNTNPSPKINYNMNFLLLFLGRLTSNLGTSIFNFALSLYVLDITGSATAFTMVLSFAIIPGIFVNILAGVFVDRNDRKKIIVVSDLLAGIMVIAFLLIFKVYSTVLLVFIAYVIVLNTIQSFFALAINASVPNIVSEERVAKANSAFQAIGPLINILGPILGAILYKAVGMQMVFIINAASFIISGISEMFIIFQQKSIEKEKAEKTSYFDNVKEVFKYLDTQKIIKFLLSMAVVLNLILNPMIFLVLQYIAYSILKVSSFQLSLIRAAWAAGTVCGALFVMTRKSVEPILKKFFVLMGVQAVLILFWYFPKLSLFDNASTWLITIIFIILVFLYGLLNTIQNIPILTHFQLKIPEELRGRVFGVMGTALTISTPIGMWIFGVALENYDWGFIPIVAGVLVLLICITQSQNKHFKQFAANLGGKNEKSKA